jgi:hypothetical protein
MSSPERDGASIYVGDAGDDVQVRLDERLS